MASLGGNAAGVVAHRVHLQVLLPAICVTSNRRSLGRRYDRQLDHAQAAIR